jgi:hypothetical protein
MLRRTMLTAVLLALLAPAAASAATKPAVTTGGVANVTFSTATLIGKVDPNGAATAYFFQYQTTNVYGVNTVTTAPASAGAGNTAVRVAVPVGALAPVTKYHYRIVAQNAKGIVRGADRTFTTKKQPLGVSLTASPNPVKPGGPVTLAGQLTGSGNAGRQVVLQGNPFPYAQGFLTLGNAVVTDPAGNFSFTLLSVPVNTLYQVLMPAKPEVRSPIVTVGAALQVTTRTKRISRTRRSVKVRFRGNVTPAAPGLRVDIQRLRAGIWTHVASTHTIEAGASHSRYSTRVRVRKGGKFRVVVEASGAYVNGVGRAVTIRRH